jgi:hypothetical protein
MQRLDRLRIAFDERLLRSPELLDRRVELF